MNFWKEPLRVIQYNLQVKDTEKMVPKEIAKGVEDLCGNALVLNIGGIYAWYDTKVRFHFKNEYLPEKFDLIEEIIKECHARNIKFIARFDFSKAVDEYYVQRPYWFVENKDKEPLVYGKDRMGNWNFLMSTCINGGYRNEDVAVPIINEILDRYDIDGVFFNAPQYEPCFCDTCKNKFFENYNYKMPENIAEFPKDWSYKCFKDNISLLYNTVKKNKSDVGVILYYDGMSIGRDFYMENLLDKYTYTDMICTEAQNIISKGVNNLPSTIKPNINMKLGNIENKPRPFGIIHSSPGMDFRHIGIPTDEYLFWMSQVPVNNGYIWHSLTGFDETISDKRILENVRNVNSKILNLEKYTIGSRIYSEVCLLWNNSVSAFGFGEALLNIGINFDVTIANRITMEELEKYKLFIIPDKTVFDDNLIKIIKNFKGKIIIENTSSIEANKIKEVLGIKEAFGVSNEKSASYIRQEIGQMLAFSGKVLYTEAKDSKTLATFVPPFAPLDGVGAPPERASLFLEDTDIPLVIEKDNVIFLPMEFGKILDKYKLVDHYKFFDYLIDMLMAKRYIKSEIIKGIQISVSKGKYTSIHLINGIGERPLASFIPYYNFKFKILNEFGNNFKIINGENVKFNIVDEYIEFELDLTDYWTTLIIE